NVSRPRSRWARCRKFNSERIFGLFLIDASMVIAVCQDISLSAMNSEVLALHCAFAPAGFIRNTLFTMCEQLEQPRIDLVGLVEIMGRMAIRLSRLGGRSGDRSVNVLAPVHDWRTTDEDEINRRRVRAGTE